MTPVERRNEHLKLVANWTNTIATAIITAGTLLPAAQFIFNILPANTDTGLVFGTGLVCIAVGAGIHLFGHLFIGSLR
jgi:hypothetical protein